MSAKVFTSVSAALDAAVQGVLAEGQKLIVMDRPAHVVFGTIRYDKGCVTTSPTRPQDGRQYNRTATGFAAQEAE